MEVTVRKMGNSRGILIPKAILAQVGLEDVAELMVRDGVIEIRPRPAPPRQGWADDARRLTAMSDDALVWPELSHPTDDALAW